MIVKVADGRRDGKTSFEKPGSYLTMGILQSGEAPTKTSWDALTQYITAESVLNSLGEEVEKTIAVETGNVNSLKTASMEMRATARHNPRQKDPVYHYILSWPEGERPATQDIFKAARHTLAALGLSEHQYIIAIHANTDNLHAHIEVNRIHPKTFKATTLNWAHETLHKAAREAEIEFSWSHDNGIYEVIEVNGQKHIVKASERAQAERQAKGAANRYEVWKGQESLESWCRGEPADALKAVLADSNMASWQDIHRVLARHGLELRDSGGKGMKVLDTSEAAPGKAGKVLAVSASKAFRFMKRSALEARLGKFESKADEVGVPETGKTYKRDPVKRLEHRLARKALREALHARFNSEVAELKKEREFAKRVMAEIFTIPDSERYDILMRGYRAKRAALKADPTVSAAEKKQMHMINRLSMQKGREALRLQLQRERSDRRALIPSIPTWREWVEAQAQLGDEAAISALRGLIYQEDRDAKKADRQSGPSIAEDTENTIRPAPGYRSLCPVPAKPDLESGEEWPCYLQL